MLKPVQPCFLAKSLGPADVDVDLQHCHNQLVLSGPIYYQNADDKIFVRKFSKNVNSKLYHIDNSKSRGQTV